MFYFRDQPHVRAAFDLVITDMFESGVMDKIMNKWTSNTNDADKNANDTATVLGIKELVFLFQMLASVAAAAVAMALAERLVWSSSPSV